tara:strand:- start:461 stop:910 length:450 start_codon:yes stop_codon:yes gene_type:complete
MGVSVFPAASAASKTRYVTTLTSGTSYTVPAGVTYVNATLFGGGGGGQRDLPGSTGTGGQVITTNVSTTPGNSIAYAIGAGGTGTGGAGNVGGTTTFAGATSAVGGSGAGAATASSTGVVGFSASNGGQSAASTGGTGGAGKIEIEYWA